MERPWRAFVQASLFNSSPNYLFPLATLQTCCIPCITLRLPLGVKQCGVRDFSVVLLPVHFGTLTAGFWALFAQALTATRCPSEQLSISKTGWPSCISNPFRRERWMPVPSSVLMVFNSRKQSLTIFTLSPHFSSAFSFVLTHFLNYRHLSRLPVVLGQLACLLLSVAIISSLSGILVSCAGLEPTFYGP